MRIFTSISLSLIILISSIGVSINKHYCKESKEYMYSFFKGNNSCVCIEDKGSDSCHNHVSCHHEQTEEEEKDGGCCHDEIVYLQLDTDYSNEFTEINLDIDWNFISAIYFSVFSDCVSLNDAPENVNYKSYKPPISDHDIPVLNQSFLI